MIQQYHSGVLARLAAAGGGGPSEPDAPPSTDLWSGYVVGETCLDSAGSPCDAGDACEDWEEKVGANGNGTQATAANQPVYDDGGSDWGNRNVLHFGGGGDHFDMPGLDGSGMTEAHVFLVARWDSDSPTSSNAGLWKYGSSGTAVVPWPGGTIYDDCMRHGRPTVGNPSQTMTLPCVYEIQSSATVYKYYLDGTEIYNSLYGSFYLQAAPQLGWAGASYSFKGEMAAFLIYDTIQTGSALTDIRDWCYSLYP